MKEGPVQDIFDAPAHPSTKALMGSIPGRLPGSSASSKSPAPHPPPPTGCPFHPRCTQADARRTTKAPAFTAIAPNRAAACWRLQ